MRQVKKVVYDYMQIVWRNYYFFNTDFAYSPHVCKSNLHLNEDVKYIIHTLDGISHSILERVDCSKWESLDSIEMLNISYSSHEIADLACIIMGTVRAFLSGTPHKLLHGDFYITLERVVSETALNAWGNINWKSIISKLHEDEVFMMQARQSMTSERINKTSLMRWLHYSYTHGITNTRFNFFDS